MKNITAMVLLAAGLGCQVAYAQTYTFTPAGAEGPTGPTQGMLDTEYTGTTLDGQVTSDSGIQIWVVPASGDYRIEAFGGQGFGPFGGRGAHITGEFNLTAGDSLKVLVGQRGAPYLNFPATTYNHQFSGGGGSFVTLSDNTPLVIAGGGGGNHASEFLAANDGQITNDGAAGALGVIIGAGGTNGNGGSQASSADAGGGLLTNGAGIAGGLAFVNGGLGGFDEGFGGFGGGGGTSSWNNYRGGGGGGYSGGGGGNNSSNCCAAGGGGGSFNDGSNPVNLAGVQLGDGLVVITSLAPTYSIGGTVSGLSGEVTLQNNNTDDLVVPGDGPFTFATELASGAGYSVEVSAQPDGQTCEVTNGIGNVGAAIIENILVVCTDNEVEPPPPPPTPVPVLPLWAMGLLILLLGGLGAHGLRQRRAHS
jgi:hypothetical protein